MNKQDKINALLSLHGRSTLSKKRYAALMSYQKDELVKTSMDGYFYYPTADCMVSTYICNNYPNNEIKINGNVYYFRRKGKDHNYIAPPTTNKMENNKVITKSAIQIKPQEPQTPQPQLYKPKTSQQDKHAHLVEYFTKKRLGTSKQTEKLNLINKDELSRTLIRTNTQNYFYYPKEDCMVISDNLENFVMKQKGRDNSCKMDVVAEHEWLKTYLNSM